MEATAVRADVVQIREALEVLFDPDQVVELRVLKVDGRKGATASGYFNDLGALASAAARYSNTRKGQVYVTLNGCNPDLQARSCNRVTDHPESTTNDGDITRRRWLFVDMDPERPAGISANGVEHDAAHELARRMRSDLQDAGWPDPVVVDSGNGAYLLYRIDLPNDDASTALVRNVLAALADHYNDDTVKIDPAVYNAARIARVPGTVNRKGDDVADRPHRLAHIVDEPEVCEVVDVALLQAMAATAERRQSADVPPFEQTTDDATKVAAAVRALATGRAFDREEWRTVGMALHSWDQSAGLQLWHEFSQQCPEKYDPEDLGRVWKSFRGNGITMATVYGMADDDAPGWRPVEPPPVLHYTTPSALARAAKVHTNGTNGHSDAGAAVAPKSKEDAKERPPKLSMQLLQLAMPECTLFCDKVGIPYAQMTINGARQTWRIESPQFGRLLTVICAAKLHTLPSSDVLSEVRRALSWHAMQSQRDVFMRVGGDGERIYLDLGRDDWAAVEIDAEGWRLVTEPPVAFRRNENMKPLPVPVQTTEFGRLRKYINIADDDWPLVAAWMVNAFRPTGPYPILALISSAGSAKSTATRVLKSLIDPAGAPLRPQPKDLRDLMIAANHSWVLGFDNVSHYPQDVSDALCRLATGGGYTTRSLYTDDGEYVIEAQRPIIFNGISEVVQAADLMDRCIIVMPPTIDDKDRMEEAQFWRKFNEDHAVLLGEFLNAVSGALRMLPQTKLDRLPRMADFAKFAAAAEQSMGMMSGTVYTLYTASRDDAMQSLFEASPLAHAILALVEKGPFNDAAERLLFELNQLVPEDTRTDKYWPKNARSLSTALNRLAPVLKTQNVTFERGKNGSRFIHIQRF